ncbi:hypothetical protein BDQ17DRAFT_1375379, partial [Cyathus striatus]
MNAFLSGYPRDLSLIRLTCKSMNNAVEPHLFHDIVLCYRTENPERLIHQLEALAYSTCGSAIKHARSLTIEALAHLVKIYSYACMQLVKSNELLEPMRAVLSMAVGALKGVSIVRWNINGDRKGEPEWVRDEVIAGLSQITSLKSLKIQFDRLLDHSCSPIRFHSIPALAELSIIALNLNVKEWDSAFHGLPEFANRSSRYLTKLHLERHSIIKRTPLYRSCSHIETLLQNALPLENLTGLTVVGYALLISDITRPHFQNLTSLSIQNGQDPNIQEENILAAWGNGKDITIIEPGADIWTGLTEENIWLQEIAIDEPTETLIQYLKSYSGLQRMTIHGAVSYTDIAQILLPRAFMNLRRRTYIIQSLTSLRKLSIATARNNTADDNTFNNDAMHGLLNAAWWNQNELQVVTGEICQTIEEF